MANRVRLIRKVRQTKNNRKFADFQRIFAFAQETRENVNL